MSIGSAILFSAGQRVATISTGWLQYDFCLFTITKMLGAKLGSEKKKLSNNLKKRDGNKQSQNRPAGEIVGKTLEDYRTKGEPKREGKDRNKKQQKLYNMFKYIEGWWGKLAPEGLDSENIDNIIECVIELADRNTDYIEPVKGGKDTPRIRGQRLRKQKLEYLDFDTGRKQIKYNPKLKQLRNFVNSDNEEAEFFKKQLIEINYWTDDTTPEVAVLISLINNWGGTQDGTKSKELHSRIMKNDNPLEEDSNFLAFLIQSEIKNLLHEARGDEIAQALDNPGDNNQMSIINANINHFSGTENGPLMINNKFKYISRLAELSPDLLSLSEVNNQGNLRQLRRSEVLSDKMTMLQGPTYKGGKAPKGAPFTESYPALYNSEKLSKPPRLYLFDKNGVDPADIVKIYDKGSLFTDHNNSLNRRKHNKHTLDPNNIPFGTNEKAEEMKFNKKTHLIGDDKRSGKRYKDNMEKQRKTIKFLIDLAKTNSKVKEKLLKNWSPNKGGKNSPPPIANINEAAIEAEVAQVSGADTIKKHDFSARPTSFWKLKDRNGRRCIHLNVHTAPSGDIEEQIQRIIKQMTVLAELYPGRMIVAGGDFYLEKAGAQTWKILTGTGSNKTAKELDPNLLGTIKLPPLVSFVRSEDGGYLSTNLGDDESGKPKAGQAADGYLVINAGPDHLATEAIGGKIVDKDVELVRNIKNNEQVVKTIPEMKKNKITDHLSIKLDIKHSGVNEQDKSLKQTKKYVTMANQSDPITASKGAPLKKPKTIKFSKKRYSQELQNIKVKGSHVNITGIDGVEGMNGEYTISDHGSTNNNCLLLSLLADYAGARIKEIGDTIRQERQLDDMAFLGFEEVSDFLIGQDITIVQWTEYPKGYVNYAGESGTGTQRIHLLLRGGNHWERMSKL